jgi:hypothetical protein
VSALPLLPFPTACLAIAKEIAVRHGASITLGSSEALGGLSARVLFHTAKAA